jgi:hypothetical protein
MLAGSLHQRQYGRAQARSYQPFAIAGSATRCFVPFRLRRTGGGQGPNGPAGSRPFSQGQGWPLEKPRNPGANPCGAATRTRPVGVPFFDSGHPALRPSGRLRRSNTFPTRLWFVSLGQAREMNERPKGAIPPPNGGTIRPKGAKPRLQPAGRSEPPAGGTTHSARDILADRHRESIMQRRVQQAAYP